MSAFGYNHWQGWTGKRYTIPLPARLPAFTSSNFFSSKVVKLYVLCHQVQHPADMNGKIEEAVATSISDTL